MKKLLSALMATALILAASAAVAATYGSDTVNVRVTIEPYSTLSIVDSGGTDVTTVTFTVTDPTQANDATAVIYAKGKANFNPSIGTSFAPAAGAPGDWIFTATVQTGATAPAKGEGGFNVPYDLTLSSVDLGDDIMTDAAVGVLTLTLSQ
jgi:hypothetical protein